MRKLFDAEGVEVEVPDEEEIKSLNQAKEEAEQLKKDLDKNIGVKNLREALSRKERLIAELQAKQEAHKSEPVVQKTPTYEAVSDDDIRKTASQAAVGALMDLEIGRKLAEFNEEDRESIKKMLGKLTAGEELNMETLPVFMAQAESAAFPDRQRSTPARAGRPPRQQDETPKGFGDTEAGKAFAASFGLKIDPPTKK